MISLEKLKRSMKPKLSKSMTKPSLRAVKGAIQSFFVLALVPVVNAAQPSVDIGDEAKLVTAITNVATTLAVILFALSAIFIVLSGFFYLTAAGNPEQVKKAKDTLIYAIVGIVLGLVAFSIDNLIEAFLK